MKKMAAPLLVLALLVPAASAAPAPDRAKEKLEALKKKLPEVVKKWGQTGGSHFSQRCRGAEFRLCRQISPTEAKVTILITHIDPPYGNGSDDDDMPLTVYLHYYDGNWTSTHYEGKWEKDRDVTCINAVRKLMLAIDELGEK